MPVPRSPECVSAKFLTACCRCRAVVVESLTVWGRAAAGRTPISGLASFTDTSLSRWLEQWLTRSTKLSEFQV